MDENTKEDYDAGFTLAFTDGSKFDVLNAGNASGSHVSIPGSAGAEGVTVTTANNAPTGLDTFGTGSTALGLNITLLLIS